MANSLVVRVVGDASSLNKMFAQSSRNAKRFEKNISSTSRGAIAGSGAFRGLGRSIAFASAGFLGAAGLTAGIRSLFDELSNAQKVGAQTAAVIKSTGNAAGVSAEHVQELADQLLKLTGIDDEVIKSGENMLLTFTNIRNVAGKNNDIFDQATRVGLDLATALQGAGFEGGNLQTTMIRLGKALNDPVRGITALRRVGVQFTKDQEKLIKRLVESGHVLEAQKLILKELTREFGGSAEAAGTTLSGKLGVLRETIRNVGADILTKLLPAITQTVDRLVAWVTNLENQQRVLEASREVIAAVTGAFGLLRGAFETLNKITGSTKRSLELLFVAFLAFKAVRLASLFTGIAANMGLIGTNAEKATVKVTGLRGALAKIKPFIAVTIAIEVITHKKQITDFFKGLGVPAADKSFAQIIGLDRGPIKKARLKLDKLFDPPTEAKAAGDAAKKAVLAAATAVSKALKGIRTAELPGLVPGVAKETKAQREARLARIRQANEAARQAVQEQAAFQVEKATRTKTLTDDLAALNNLNALLARRIKGGHKTLELEREQFQVQQQIADVLKQQAEARKQQRDNRQFRLLGFGAGGADIIPGVKSLKRQLESVTDAIEGGFLDTKKTRARLRNIRKVLAEGVNNVSADVRAKIQQLIQDLQDKLKNASVDVTRFNKTASGQFVTQGAVGAGSRDIVVQGGIHLHGIQNVKQLENELAKRKKQRGRQRRSTR